MGTVWIMSLIRKVTVSVSQSELKFGDETVRYSG